MIAAEEVSSKIPYKWTAVVCQCKQRGTVQAFDAARLQSDRTPCKVHNPVQKDYSG